MRVIQSLAYSIGIIFFVMGQVGIWHKLDSTVPYLLSSVVMILAAMYLKDDSK